MSVAVAMGTPLREVLASLLVLQLVAQAYLLTGLLGYRRSVRRAVHVAHFILSLVVTYLLLDLLFCQDRPGMPMAAHVVGFGSLPASVLVAYVAVSLVLVTRAALWSRLYRPDNLEPSVIKETVDLLPAGVAFGGGDGQVLLSNVTMQELSRALLGKMLTNVDELVDAIEGAASAFDDAEAEDGPSALESGLLRVDLPADAGTWQFSVWRTEQDGVPLTQVVATDVTRQAQVTDELLAANERLRDVNMRLDIYESQAERMVIAREMLAARMQVHDQAGHVLLLSRHYLDHPGDIDARGLLKALKATNEYLLREYEQDDTARDALADAVETARAIGVEVAFEGDLPQEADPRSVLAAALRECATNAVKHAGGDELLVQVDRLPRGWSMRLANNGTPPQGTVCETGGLGTLRALVERKGGTMGLVGGDAFAVEITLPDDGARGGGAA